MNFSGKKMKIIASCLIAGGGIVSIASAAMLGVSTQYNANFPSPKGDPNTVPFENTPIPVGSVNYDYKKAFNIIPGLPVNASYNDFVRLMKENKPLMEQSKEALNTPLGKKYYDASMKFINDVIMANDLMIAGAVLFPLSTLTLIGGLCLFFLGRKK